MHSERAYIFYMSDHTFILCISGEENLRCPLPVCELKENVLEVLGQLWRCKVLEREKVVSLSNCQCLNIYVIIFSTLLL